MLSSRTVMSETRTPTPSRLSERLRRHAGALVVDNFFRGIATVGRWHPRAKPERHNVRVEHDVEYLPTGLAEHRLDVYRPVTGGEAGALPAVLYVHGGGFRILSKDTHWVMALAFARQGYVVFNVSYRLAPAHPFPTPLADVCAAFAWVVGNAARFGADPTRLVLAGESAGANLVTALAAATAYERPEPWARAAWELGVVPRAVLPACGMLQVSEPERFRERWPRMSPFVYDRLAEVSEAYLDGYRGASPEALDLADPLVLLERGRTPERKLPPFLATVGTKDPLLDDTRRLKGALDALGVECEAHYYPGEMHAFHALVWRPNARRFWAHTYRFLERHCPSPAARTIAGA
jgi:acetyl esterase/lipase